MLSVPVWRDFPVRFSAPERGILLQFMKRRYRQVDDVDPFRTKVLAA